MNEAEGMKGIPAIAVANTIANTEEGKKAIGQSITAAKYLTLGIASVFVFRFANSKFKELRADRFARRNIGNPNLTAAAIIYEAFTRIGFPPSSLLSYLIPSVNISTDEAALFAIASKVTNVKAVSEAYSILFNRNLFEDLRKGLDTKELKKFWEIISSPSRNTNQTQLYPIGTDLYSASKTMITVNIAEQINGKWKGTGRLYKTFKFGEEIGEVIAHGVFKKPDGTKENYYIVKRYFISFPFPILKTGVVVQHQVTNEKL